MRIIKYLMALIVCQSINFFALSASAQEAPVVGKRAAQKYFQEDADRAKQPLTENVLSLHIGRYVQSQSYDWGASAKMENVGAANYGVTYLFDNWHGLDLNIRVDLAEYSLGNNHAQKISVLPVLSFPRVDTRFPLYFGLGAGPGVFTQQMPDRSSFALDYQIFAGARFMELAPGVGAFVEWGLKNHLHLTSVGQLNGTVFSGGAVFNF